MRDSYAKQQEFDFFSGNTYSNADGRHSAVGEISDSSAQSRSDSGTSEVAYPQFRIPSNLYADASRRAGRLNAANISDTDLDHLLLERQMLLDKKFSKTITRAETIRLEYVRWQLDRIEDARTGQALDALEALVTQYEQFKEDLELLQSQLLQHTVKGKRPQ